MTISELREYQAEFEKLRPDIASKSQKLLKLVNKFKADYTIKKILSLSRDEYVVGKGDSTTFCNRIENELKAWGGIHGSQARKFGIYYGKYGKDTEQKYRIGKAAFGDGTDVAFEKVKSSIIELIENHDNLELLKLNMISTMFKGKILSIYFPDKFLRFYSANYLDHFINVFALENNSSNALDKQNELLNFKNNDRKMQDWSTFEFGYFLYYFFKPASSKDSSKEIFSKELYDFKLPDFPPIEKTKIAFVDLQTNPISDSQERNGHNSKKVDYSIQSKKFKRIGSRGEQIAITKERQRLIENGREDLAKAVDHISKRDDTVGYDIVSYDSNGTKKYIEVKSTLNSIGPNRIFISANEFRTSKTLENYYFYFVYDTGSEKPKIWEIKGDELLTDENVKIEPSQYKVRLITELK